MMRTGSVVSAVLAVALGATLGTAEAKLVRYEINGQRYSYSTNNRQQVRAARSASSGPAGRRRARRQPASAAFRIADPDQRDRGAGAGSAGARAAVPSHRPHQFGQEQPRRTPRRPQPRAKWSRVRRAAQAEARQTRLSRTPQLLADETAGKAKPATTRPTASGERLTAMDAKHEEVASLAPHATASGPGPGS